MKTIIVNDPVQKGYTYTLTEKMGVNFDPVFKPHLTPKEMLELGVFGGIYFADEIAEFPKDWFTHARLSPKEYDKNLNYFRIKASQSLAIWQKNGWIHKDDPRGWFQWYCRYYMGRRHPDDQRQIKRWFNMRRHVVWLQGACRQADIYCRPRQRQALLHWAYDSRVL
jgi:hypothetical protein